MVTVRLRVEFEEVPGQGWVVETQDVAAIAQGATKEEALANLRALIETYPEVLDELLKQRRPELELVPA